MCGGVYAMLLSESPVTPAFVSSSGLWRRDVCFLALAFALSLFYVRLWGRGSRVREVFTAATDRTAC